MPPPPTRRPRSAGRRTLSRAAGALASRYPLEVDHVYVIETPEEGLTRVSSGVGACPRPPASAAPAAARSQIVAHHVVAELVVGRREDPSAVAFGELVHEIDEPLVVGEHEDVER